MFKKMLMVGFVLCSPINLLAGPVSDDAHGTRSYDEYEKPQVCQSCHNNIYQQWSQAMMSQAFTHHWDEI